jgi:hypothetical protein
MSKYKKQSGWKIFLKNWDKWDTVTGYLWGAATIGFVVAFPFLLFSGIEAVEILKSMMPNMVLVFKIAFFMMCMSKAVVFIKPPYRTRAFVPKGFWHFISGNMIALSWISGGFSILLGPEVILRILQIWK